MLKSLRFWTGAVVAFDIGLVVSAIYFWDWLIGDTGSPSDVIRNAFLVGGAPIAALLAVWRSKVAERGLQNDRYQKGAEMLGSSVLSVRLGGIYALQQLATEHPEEYHVQILRLLCIFVRQSAPNSSMENGTVLATGRTDYVTNYPNTPSPDVQAALNAIGNRTTRQIQIENISGYGPDLQNSYLRGANCSNGNFAHAILAFCDLSNALFVDSKLNDVMFHDAKLTSAIFSFKGASPAKGLTQDLLDIACAEENHFPYLKGVKDAVTGKQMHWSGKILPDSNLQECLSRPT